MTALSSRSYILLLLFVILQILTQPSFLIGGDPRAIMDEARYLLKTRTLGIPFEAKNEINSGLLPPSSEPDQFFWENQKSQRYFSRWGITNTLAFLIPAALEGSNATATRQILASNTWNITLSTITATIFLMFAQSSGNVVWSQLIVFSFILATALSHYFRAQSSEILQITLLSAALILYRQINQRLDHGRDTSTQLSLKLLMCSMSCVLFALVHAKVYFIVFFGICIITMFWSRWRERQHWPLIMIGLLALISCGLFQLWLNDYKFSNPFEMGLGPATPRKVSDWYDIANFKNSIPDYVFGRNGSVFSFFPLFIFSLIGAKYHAQIHRRESWAIWLNLIAVIIVAGGWKNNLGEWCLGPRYLVPAIALTIIPAQFAFRSIAAYNWSHARKFTFVCIFVVLLCFGAARQVLAGRFDFFVVQQLSGTFDSVNAQIFADDYFKRENPYAITSDLRSICRGDRQGHLYALDRTLRIIKSDYASALDKIWSNLCTPNVFFLRL